MPKIEFYDKSVEQAIKNNFKIKTIREKHLLAINGIYISDDDDVNCYPIPWYSDSQAYQMERVNMFYNKSRSNGRWEDDLITRCAHIKTLYIIATKAQIDLNFLGEFKNLQELTVIHSNVSDWSFVERLMNLRNICVHACPNFDIKSLGVLAKKQQERYDNHVNQETEKNMTTFLQRPIRLENIYAKYCNISDISPLCTNLRDVTEINLSHNNIKDISSLTGIDVYYLTLRWNQIEDITALNDSKSYLVNLRHNQIKDFSPLYENQHIHRLFVNHNAKEDYNKLHDLSLVYTDIPNYNEY